MAEYVDKRCDYCKEILPEGVNAIVSCSLCGDASERHRKYLEWKARQEKDAFDGLFG